MFKLILSVALLSMLSLNAFGSNYFMNIFPNLDDSVCKGQLMTNAIKECVQSRTQGLYSKNGLWPSLLTSKRVCCLYWVVIDCVTDKAKDFCVVDELNNLEEEKGEILSKFEERPFCHNYTYQPNVYKNCNY